jgi:hypothetical protein
MTSDRVLYWTILSFGVLFFLFPFVGIALNMYMHPEQYRSDSELERPDGLEVLKSAYLADADADTVAYILAVDAWTGAEPRKEEPVFDPWDQSTMMRLMKAAYYREGAPLPDRAPTWDDKEWKVR